MTASKSINITGYSTALFSTWYFVDDMGLLFDCGDGVCAGLMQKSRKIKHVFISHAHRDHIAGLLQFNQLNARAGLRIYYPKDSGSFRALAEFSAKFDPQSSGTKWIPITVGDEFRIRENLTVRAIENRHVPITEGVTKSLTYIVERISRKLKPEFVGKPSEEIASIRRENGEEAISNISRSTQLIYSGDTPIENDGRYSDTDILIHEATFLTAGEIDPDNPKRNKHSSLDQVISMVAGSNIKTLVLGHFSNRYSHDEIRDAVRMQCEMHELKIPVHLVLPGELRQNILNNVAD